jgi:hypothetical protein
VRGDRAIVDDAAAARALILHQSERLLRAQERAGEIGVDHLAPFFIRHVLEWQERRVRAGVVEQHVEPAEFLVRGIEQ